MKGRHLDLSSPGPSDNEMGDKASDGRPFLGVRFACCDVYHRIYLNLEGTQYVGNCPRCAKPVRFQVGPGGTDCRFFTAQ